MRRPPSLIGYAAGGAYFCEGWELRITGRCLSEDLNAGAETDFDEVSGLEIVRALVRERRTSIEGTRDVNGLQCGHTAWVLAHGHDHRGATIYDSEEEVVWLVAYGRHRSGQDDDFFPYCRSLDADERLLPTPDDYERMHRERDYRFVEAVRLEGPEILRHARHNPGEHRHLLAGDISAGIAVEVVPGAAAITIAFQLDAVSWDRVPVLLAALWPGGNWELIGRMPSRDLEPGEIAHTVMLEDT